MSDKKSFQDFLNEVEAKKLAELALPKLPIPKPRPAPKPVPRPEPRPTPRPEPQPKIDQPKPGEAPSRPSTPEPAPGPDVKPTPAPKPQPAPTPGPEVKPIPTPTPIPIPGPEQEPTPGPRQEPTPSKPESTKPGETKPSPTVPLPIPIPGGNNIGSGLDFWRFGGPTPPKGIPDFKPLKDLKEFEQMTDIQKSLYIVESMSSATKNPTGPKFPGYWMGTDPASDAKHKMVGGSEEQQESVLGELDKTAKDTAIQRKLQEKYKEFKEDNWAAEPNQTTDTSAAKPTTTATTTPPSATSDQMVPGKPGWNKGVETKPIEGPGGTPFGIYPKAFPKRDPSPIYKGTDSEPANILGLIPGVIGVTGALGTYSGELNKSEAEWLAKQRAEAGIEYKPPTAADHKAVIRQIDQQIAQQAEKQKAEIEKQIQSTPVKPDTTRPATAAGPLVKQPAAKPIASTDDNTARLQQLSGISTPTGSSAKTQPDTTPEPEIDADELPQQMEPSSTGLDPSGRKTSDTDPRSTTYGDSSKLKSTSWQELAKLNPQIKNPNLIYVGQQITAPNGDIYTVQKGDTLSKIAANWNQQMGFTAGAKPPTTKPPVQKPQQPTVPAGSSGKVELPPNAVTSPTTGQPWLSGSGEPWTSGQTPAPTKPAPGVNPWTGKDPAKAEAWSKLTPRQQAYVGMADPTDSIIVSRAKAANPAEYDLSYQDRSNLNKVVGGLEGQSYSGHYGFFGGKMRAKDNAGRPYITPEEWSQQNLGQSKPLDQMTMSEVQQFQKARGGQANAVGMYGFTGTTLDALKKQLDIPDNAVFDAKTQEAMQNQLLNNNLAELQRNKIPVSPATVYSAHFIGPAGTNQVLNAAKTEPNATVADILARKAGAPGTPAHEERMAYLSKNNPALASTTAGNWIASMDKKYNDKLQAQSQQTQIAMRENRDDKKVAGRYSYDEFDDLVDRLRAKAKAQEKKQGPVDLGKLMQRLRDIEDKDDKPIKEEEPPSLATNPTMQATSPARQATNPYAQDTTAGTQATSQAGTPQQQQQKRDQAIDASTARGVADTIGSVAPPGTNTDALAQAIVNANDGKPLTRDQQRAMGTITPLVLKAAETPTAAGPLKTALQQAGILAKQGK